MQERYNIEEFNEILLHRRSIYPYQYAKGKVIPDAIIWQILENANRAPNHKQTEPWRFCVFSGGGLKYFGQLQAGIYREFAADSYQQDRYKKLIEYPLMSSHVISIGMKRSGADKLPEIEEVEAVACAVQNMFLTVTAYVLGFLYIGYVEKPVTAISKRKPIGSKVNWIDNIEGIKPPD